MGVHADCLLGSAVRGPSAGHEPARRSGLHEDNIVADEPIVGGFDRAVDAFLGMLPCGSVDEMIVRLVESRGHADVLAPLCQQDGNVVIANRGGRHT